MKIIDKTPLLDEKGNLGFAQKLQGAFEYGFGWQKELQIQKAIVSLFERNLDKNYTLLRNVSLGQSGISIPIILLGSAGLFVINIAHEPGHYVAQGEAWSIETSGKLKPAKVNLIQETQRMARALRKFIERQGVYVPTDFESILIAGDPGVHIESSQSAIRVILIDAVKTFASTLAITRATISPEIVFELSERVANPLPPKKAGAKPAMAPSVQAPAQPENPSRARAIFSASDEVKPFNPNDFGFDMSDESPADLPFDQETPIEADAPPAQKVQPAARKRKLLGMQTWQLLVVVGLVLLICVVIAGAVFFLVPFAS